MEQVVMDFEREFDSAVGRFEARLHELGQRGLLLWSGVLRVIVRDLVAEFRSRNDAVYKQLMLLESFVHSEVESPAEREALLERIAKLKGLLLVVFGLTMGANVWLVEDEEWRQVRRNRRRDEVNMLGVAA